MGGQVETGIYVHRSAIPYQRGSAVAYVDITVPFGEDMVVIAHKLEAGKDPRFEAYHG